jgi:hypothetical protein
VSSENLFSIMLLLVTAFLIAELSVAQNKNPTKNNPYFLTVICTFRFRYDTTPGMIP